ncbi:hypothetical protein ACIPLA_13255 [Pseudomonas sp. NPDC086112]|nr:MULTISPECIES: hypothetical protein [unclassified Pseudomonas]
MSTSFEVQRNDIPDDDYYDEIFGCVDTIGPLAGAHCPHPSAR